MYHYEAGVDDMESVPKPTYQFTPMVDPSFSNGNFYLGPRAGPGHYPRYKPRSAPQSRRPLQWTNHDGNVTASSDRKSRPTPVAQRPTEWTDHNDVTDDEDEGDPYFENFISKEEEATTEEKKESLWQRLKKTVTQKDKSKEEKVDSEVTKRQRTKRPKPNTEEPDPFSIRYSPTPKPPGSMDFWGLDSYKT